MRSPSGVLAGVGYHGFGGPTRFHLLPGFEVGGSLESPGSSVTCLGFVTPPPRGPVSLYSPGRAGFSPGFWFCAITNSYALFLTHPETVIEERSLAFLPFVLTVVVSNGKLPLYSVLVGGWL